MQEEPHASLWQVQVQAGIAQWASSPASIIKDTLKEAQNVSRVSIAEKGSALADQLRVQNPAEAH